MAAWTLYVLAYLMGIATPVILVRRLLRHEGDGSACLLDVTLFLLAALMLLSLWLGIRVS